MIGSYTDQRNVAYLMEPVGECNLHTYLCQSRSFIDERTPSLRNYFGCLANAVAYLHRQRVRHRDLKPQNILVRNHTVYITDFGTALDWSKRGRDTTNDPTTPFTEYYMAPEVAKRSASSRNSASDIWSLGIVFLDMVTVLCGSTIRELRAFLQTHGTRHPCVWNNTSVVTNEWFQRLRQANAGPESDNEPMIWIKDMLQLGPGNRPLSGALTNQIRSAAALGHFIGHCCGMDDELEDYPSPPSSAGSEEDAKLQFDDMPPELDLSEKPFGSLVESSRQSSIEKWLGVDSHVNDFISDVASEPPDMLESDFIDFPYDIVEDDTKGTIVVLDQENSEQEVKAARKQKTVDTCDGYDIVQDDSDDEVEQGTGGHGYEVMEDSSGSEATIRQVHLPKTTTTKQNACESIATPGSSGEVQTEDSGPMPSEVVQSLVDQLDTLPEDPVGDTLEEMSREESPMSTSLGCSTAEKAGFIGQFDALLGCPIETTSGQDPLTSSNLDFLNAARQGAASRYDVPPSQSARDTEQDSISQRPLGSATLEPLETTEQDAVNQCEALQDDSRRETPQYLPSPEPSTGINLNSSNATNVSEVVHPIRPSPKASERSRRRRMRMAAIAGEESQISPSVYMREVWEAASSAPTSVMSERTKKTFAKLGSGLAWQDKTANFLVKYVSLGKASAVRELLRAGCNPGTRDKPRIRPLMAGVKGGSQRHNKCVAALLTAGADANARERSGRTALHYAIEHQNFPGYTNLIRDLLEAGADPNNTDKSGDSPLLQILYGGYEPLEKHRRDALACLLQDVFATDVNVIHPGTGNMPLHLAVRRKDPWAVSMLLTRGALVNEPNASGSTPLMLAANGWSMRMAPSQNKVLEFLLDGGANVNERNELGKTALHFAASKLCARAMELLLNKGADPKILDREAHGALFYAGNSPTKIEKSPKAHAAIMEMLFDAIGYDLLPSEEGVCSVVTAVSQSRCENVEALLDNGAEVNHRYKSIQGTPLLHVALSNQDVPMVQLLVDKGALVDIENSNGWGAFMVCDSLPKTASTRSNFLYMKKHGKRSKNSKPT